MPHLQVINTDWQKSTCPFNNQRTIPFPQLRAKNTPILYFLKAQKNFNIGKSKLRKCTCYSINISTNPGGPVLSIVYFQTDLPSFTTLSSTKFVHASSRICCFVISVGEKSCLNIETKMVEMFINRYELITQNMEHTFFESFSLYPKVQEKLQRV